MSDCGDVKKVFVPTKTADETPQANEVIKGIQITDVAAEKLNLFLKNDGKDPEAHCLWVTVVKDGCSGNSYTMDLKAIDEAKEAGAKFFVHNGATVAIETLSYLFVTGSILDYTEALTGSGFTLNNPNIKRTCSCGSSFSV